MESVEAVVIGAGVIGLAVARALAMAGREVIVLEAEDAIKKWRTLMGATDPAKADAGTLRKEFAESIERNSTHGSDAPETAAYEIGYFFAGIDLI